MVDRESDVTKPRTPEEKRIRVFVYVALFVVVTVAVGIPAWRGYAEFQRQMILTNREMIVRDLNLLAQEVFLYRDETNENAQPRGTYQGYVLPEGLKQNSNGEYAVTVESANKVVLFAKSRVTEGAVKVMVDSTGEATNWEFSGRLGEGGKR